MSSCVYRIYSLWQNSRTFTVYRYSDIGSLLTVACCKNLTECTLCLRQARHPRATAPSVLRTYLIEEAKKLGRSSSQETWTFQDSFTSVSETLDRCLTKAADDGNSIVLIFGTAFIMSEARAQLGIVEPRDSVFLSDSESRDTQVCL